MLSRYTFDYPFRLFLVILPFMTFLSVFTKEKLGIPGFAFIKELILATMIMTVLGYHITGKYRIVFGNIDIVIGLYIVTLFGISLFTTGLSGIIYGGRYDFSFFLAFLALYHGVVFLKKTTSYYIRIFLISSGVMLFLSMLLKWPLSEDVLLYFGYSGDPSHWQFGSSIPIFHGVDGANVRRFQGLLDGPNTMGAFIIMYIGVLLYFFKDRKNWHFVIGGGVFLLSVCIFYTYSRSAALGLIGGVGIVILFLLPKIYKNYRVQFLTILTILILGGTFLGVQYSGSMKAIVERGGSTLGHMERMKVGIQRFIEHPLGQGLGSAGPGYRYVKNLANTDRKNIEEMDRYYIPESWYIQQLIEGGMVGFLAFIAIIVLLLIQITRKHIFLGAAFFGICIMNFFLHTFESAILSLLLFSLLGLLLAPRTVYAKPSR